MVSRQFKGPVRPGIDEQVFRETGISVSSGSGGGVFVGPVRLGRDEEIFRRTGRSVISGSAEATRIQSQFIAQRQAQAQAEVQRLEDIETQRKAKEEAQKRLERQEALRQQRQKAVLFEQRLSQEARIKKRGLTQAEKESIRRGIFGRRPPKFDPQRAKVVREALAKFKEEQKRPREILPGETGRGERILEIEKGFGESALRILRQRKVIGVGDPSQISKPVVQKILKTKIARATGEFLFGEAGKPFVGVQVFVPGVRTKTIPISEIKKVAREKAEKIKGKKGFVVRTGVAIGDIIIPETPGEVAILAAIPPTLKVLPRVLGRGVSAGIGALTVPQVLRTDLDPEQRIAFATVGIVAGVGTVFPTRAGLGIKAQKAQLKLLKKRGIVTEETAKALSEAITLQKFLRRQKDVPIKKTLREIIPKELTLKQKQVVERFILEEKPTIFGGKTLELRDIRKSGDIDITIKDNTKKLNQFIKELKKVSKPRDIVKKGEAIGIKGEKLLDVKAEARTKEFLLRQRPIKTKEGVKVTKISEQFSRALSGTLELRKGGKDIGDVLLSAEAIIRQSAIRAEKTGLPSLKSLRKFKVFRAEKRLEKVSKALPELQRIVEKFGKSEIVDLPASFEPRTRLPAIADILVPGKKAQVRLPSEITRLEPRLPPKKVPIKKVKIKGKTVEQIIRESTIEPSEFRTPKIKKLTPTKLVPSFIKPPRRKIEPSKIPKIPKTPKEILEPSIITPQPRKPGTPPPIIPEPSDIRTPKIIPDIILPTEKIIIPGLPRVPKEKPRRLFLGAPRRLKKPIPKGTQGYDVFVKQLRTKRQKQFKERFKPNKINVNSLEKERARDLLFFGLDTSLERRGFIQATKRKPKPPILDVPSGYAKQTRRKFRDFKQRKGVRRKLKKEEFIERSKFLLDTPQEVAKINIQRRIAELRKQSKNKKRFKDNLNFIR